MTDWICTKCGKIHDGIECPDDNRQEAERVWAEANRVYDVIPKITDDDAAYMAATDIIAAARVRWQNEAIDRMRDAAKSAVYFGLDAGETHKARAICAQIEADARTLKKE